MLPGQSFISFGSTVQNRLKTFLNLPADKMMSRPSGLCALNLFATFASTFCHKLSVLPEQAEMAVLDVESQEEDVAANGTLKNSAGLYEKAYTYLKGTKAFINFTYEVRISTFYVTFIHVNKL